MGIRYFFREKEHTLDIPEGMDNLTLAQALWLGGELPPKALCAGLRTCGRCRVRFCAQPPASTPAEQKIFSQEELEKGFRLACRHRAEHNIVVEVPDYSTLPSKDFPTETKPVTGGLAVDWGTSSIVWRFCPATDTGCVQEEQSINPQMPAGSDIMARLALAANPAGLVYLRSISQSFLQSVLHTLKEKNLFVTEIVLAANPAMASLSVGEKSPEGLSHAPYTLEEQGGAYATGTKNLPPLWVVPHISPFVGGDISAGLAAVFLQHKANAPFILADMGTNGEFALVSAQGEITVTSVPLGPALEGSGLECGGLAGPGSVTRYSLGPTGIQQELFANTFSPAQGPATSITGAAYLCLLALLKNVGLLDTHGHFKEASAHPLARKIAGNFRKRHGEPVLDLPDSLYISATDVENILKVKAAFSCALHTLHTFTHPEKQPRLFLAGALGKHAPLLALETLGFIPSRLVPHTQSIGNSALDGAHLLLQKHNRLFLAEKLSHVFCLQLTQLPDFQNLYLNSMTF